MWYLTHRKRICGSLWNIFWAFAACIRNFGSQNVCLGDGCGRKSPIEEGGKTSSRKHRLITRTPGRRVIVLTGCVSIVCIFIRELFLRKECAMFKKMRVASARRNDRVGLRTSLSAWQCHVQENYCTRNVQEMYRKCMRKMYKGMYRNCTVLNTNVQRMYRNSMMDLFKNGPNHVIGLGGALRAATYGESARYHCFSVVSGTIWANGPQWVKQINLGKN